MADHWEIGVVLALRDAQWLSSNPGAELPAINISLDGNAESKMGDGIHQIGERFALLEIKPDQSFCDSEWTASKGPKRAYKKLMDLAAGDETSQGSAPSRLRLSQSTRGHFFAYWGDTAGAGSHLDQLFLQPYLLTALDALPASSQLKAPGSCYSGRPSFQHAATLISSLTIGLASTNRFKPLWPLTLAQVLSIPYPSRLNAYFCLKDPTATSVLSTDLLPLGLEIDELQSYANFLCTESIADGCQNNVLGEDLKLMLIGSNGFIRHINKTSELMEVIVAYRENRLTPTPGNSPTVNDYSPLTIDSPKSAPRPRSP